MAACKAAIPKSLKQTQLANTGFKKTIFTFELICCLNYPFQIEKANMCSKGKHLLKFDDTSSQNISIMLILITGEL